MALANHWLDKVHPAARALVNSWLSGSVCRIKLTRSRSSKYGDFRPASRGRSPQITVNGDLPTFRFLLTLTHEIAHLMVWRTHQLSVQPHGPEWKRQFADLLRELALLDDLPTLFRNAILRHARRPKASGGLDTQLAQALQTLDGGEPILDSIPIGAIFSMGDRTFRKISVQRTRCLCLEIETGQRYRVARSATVTPVSIRNNAR